MSVNVEALVQLPPNYRIRPICFGDYDRGVFKVLEELAPVGVVSRTAFARYLNYIEQHREMHHTLVIVKDDDLVVAVGSLILEPKLIHRCGLVGHIEDIAVARVEQSQGLGTQMLRALDLLAQMRGVYKNVLNCSRYNEPYYHKRGYENIGCMMVKRFF